MISNFEKALGMRRPSRTGLQPLPLENVLRNNSTLARVAEIARRAGVVVDVDNIKSEFADAQNLDSPIARHYFVVRIIAFLMYPHNNSLS